MQHWNKPTLIRQVKALALNITLTALLNWGAAGTEYGGYIIPGTGFTTAPADTISAWITWYF